LIWNIRKRPPETSEFEVHVEHVRSLDSFKVAAPIPVEVPVAQMESTPSAPATPPQDTAPTDFDG
jgi:hypothetical protein